MRKFSILTCLTMLLLLSCREEEFDMDLLYGNWIEESDTGHPRPMIDFTAGGEYCMTDYLNVMPGSLTVYRCEITGEFEIEGRFITFVTAEVQGIEPATGSDGYPYEELDLTEGVPFGSFYGSQDNFWSRPGSDIRSSSGTEYTPVTWEIMSLNEDLLEVKVSLDNVRYVRQ